MGTKGKAQPKKDFCHCLLKDLKDMGTIDLSKYRTIKDKLLPCLRCAKKFKTWSGRRICPKCTGRSHGKVDVHEIPMRHLLPA